MRIIKPGEPCPCCGAPIRDDLPRWKLLLLSCIAEELSLMGAINATERRAGEQERYANNIDNLPENPERVPDEIAGGQTWAEEKRAIAQRLKDYRGAHGLGCLARVSQKTAHREESRISEDTLREIAAGRAPKMELSEWHKIAMALNELDAIKKEKLDA